MRGERNVVGGRICLKRVRVGRTRHSERGSWRARERKAERMARAVTR